MSDMVTGIGARSLLQFGVQIEDPILDGAAGSTAIRSSSKTVDLMGLAARPDTRQCIAAHHSEKWVEFPARQDGPVKGVRF
jgi:hypothetical protein